MFSEAMLLRTDTRSGTPASPQFPRSSAAHTGRHDTTTHTVSASDCGGKVSFKQKAAEQSDVAANRQQQQKLQQQQTSLKYLFSLKNVGFVMVS